MSVAEEREACARIGDQILAELDMKGRVDDALERAVNATIGLYQAKIRLREFDRPKVVRYYGINLDKLRTFRKWR